MNSAPERFAAETDLDGLTDDARALFGTGLCDSLGWYRAIIEAALPVGGKGCFLVVGEPARVVFPMLRLARGAASLTTPYTCLWAPLTAPGLDAAVLQRAGRALADWCRPHGTVRLDALDLADPRWRDILAGVRAGGMAALPFAHFGNWYIDVTGEDFDAYLAARPGALRTTLKRRGARLHADGAGLRIVTGSADLAQGIEAYETVYARSWKQPEPYPAFTATLMRACAADGSLRLALLEKAGLERDGKALAAQFWVVHGGTATVLKLAYDEAERAHSPGTVLTGLAIRYLMENDAVTGLDFGRGDDSYKCDWTGMRRERCGVLLVNPLSAGGLLAMARHLAGRLKARLLASWAGPRYNMTLDKQARSKEAVLF